MSGESKTSAILFSLALVFVGLAAAFGARLWGRPQPLSPIPLVDSNFLSTATIRTSYVQLIQLAEAKKKTGDPDLKQIKSALEDFDCYTCHEQGKPPTLRFDTNMNLIIPQEHSDIVMAHGSHNRNNNCFNCHDEKNLLQLQTRDGHEVKFEESPRLCGSCHGPTYRDWEAGAHGRTGGYWDRSLGPIRRQICADCHNPHAPKIPGRKPAPGPHPLHPVPAETAEK
jgi:hypothetical protein